MKIVQLLTIAVLLILSSCSSSKFTLAGKEYSLGSEIKSESIDFVSDNICLYTQIYHCNIPEKYKITEIECSYTISGDTITLKRISSPEYLENQSCYIMPDSIIVNCEPMFADTRKSPLFLGRYWTKVDAYRVINSINVEEKLLYYKGCIYYAKFLSCYSKESTASSFYVFCEGGRKANRKIRSMKKLTRQRRIPINDFDLVLRR
ncbi:MAG: hypothetical protein LBG19_02225 [Prevotellaceae bacterium]|jgi:hypothetical protein|nr:hypothetical protein [Prevotellaceae bacterium]